MSQKQGIAFDGIPDASFNDIKFPVERVSIRSSMRHVVHEYPHTPGGEPEKLGRKLYSIKMIVPAHDNFDAYPLLWPDGISALRNLYESGETLKLVIPTVGGIMAFIDDWDQEMTWEVRSGESLTMSFLEDQEDANLAALIERLQSPDIELPNDNFQALALGVTPRPTIFDDINDAVTAVLAVRDQANLYSDMVAAKIQKVADLCGEADRSVDALQGASAFRIVEALKQLWKASIDLAQNASGKAPQLQHYTTPRRMTIVDVSKAVYRDSSRSVEILQLNALDDAFAIPAGTDIRYFAAEGALQGARA